MVRPGEPGHLASGDNRECRTKTPRVGALLTHGRYALLVYLMCGYSYILPRMKDIHVWLPDDEAEQFAALAREEERSITAMVRKLAREAMAERNRKKAANE